MTEVSRQLQSLFPSVEYISLSLSDGNPTLTVGEIEVRFTKGYLRRKKAVFNVDIYARVVAGIAGGRATSESN